jgi:hypothetical protein
VKFRARNAAAPPVIEMIWATASLRTAERDVVPMELPSLCR